MTRPASTTVSCWASKGTLAESELRFLRARMQGGLLAKARRGELKLRLPAGLACDAAGIIMLDPDTGVRGAVQLLLDTFTGAASAPPSGAAGDASRVPQGMVIGGGCGRGTRVGSPPLPGRTRVPACHCQRAGIRSALPACQAITGTSIDAAISALICDTLTPLALQNA